MSELTDRFWAMVDRRGDNECWDWNGELNHGGYGVMRYKGKKIISHRFSFELFNGEIKYGLEIDHLCRNRKCCNPKHLEQVTHKENVFRGIGLASINHSKTHCKHGHLLFGDNLYIYPNGDRACRICIYKWNKDRRTRLADQ